MMINKNISKSTKQDEYLAIDEGMYLTCGKIAFETYNREKLGNLLTAAIISINICYNYLSSVSTSISIQFF